MVIGVPKEIKTLENRVALTPGGVESLVKRGHTVLVERGPGRARGLPMRSTPGPGPSSWAGRRPGGRRWW